MALQNFVDYVGPKISAAWLNIVDRLRETVFEDAATKAAARTALTSDAPLEVYNGGTGNRFGLVYHQETTDETNAGVTPTDYSYPPMDIRRYGGDPTGITNSDSALVDALSVCGSLGSTIRFPTGHYVFANQYDLSSKRSIIFQGDGAGTSAATNATYLTYSGTASPWFNCPLASAIEWRDMELTHSAVGFTGTYIKFGAIGANPGAYHRLSNVSVGALVSATVHLDLDKTICCSFSRCVFLNGNPSIKGQISTGGSYSNVMSFSDCSWINSQQNSVAYGGESWTFNSCNFEMLASGQCGAFGTITTTPCKGVSFINCWFGDATVAGGIWITFFGQGLSFTGNRMAGTVGSYGISLNEASGVSITGNTIESFTAPVTFDTAPVRAVVFTGNYCSGLTVAFGGEANVPADFVYNPNYVTNIATPLGPPNPCGELGEDGWVANAGGIITEWGSEAVTAGVPVVVTFTKAFPTALWNVQLTLVTPANGTNVVSATTLSTSGVTLNVTGAGANTVHWYAIGN